MVQHEPRAIVGTRAFPLSRGKMQAHCWKVTYIPFMIRLKKDKQIYYLSVKSTTHLQDCVARVIKDCVITKTERLQNLHVN